MMVATSVAVTTSTNTSPSAVMTETSPATVPTTVASAPSASDATGEVAVPPNVSPTAYQLLLKQVESLQMENSSLKAELKNNTSHISKLENEASRMKDMVLMLGKPVISGVGIEGNTSSNNNVPHSGRMGPSPTLDDNSPSNVVNGAPALSHNFPAAQFLTQKFQSNVENDARRFRSQHLMDMHAAVPAAVKTDVPPPYHTANGSVSPPPSTAVADAIRRQLVLLNADRSRILVMVQKEEHQKDVYMKQLKELTQRLDSMSDSDKFTKPNDKTRQQLELDISNLQQRMEKTLGSPDVMEGQLQTWLRQIQILEREIQSLEQHLHKLEMTPTSPDLPQFPSVRSHMEVIGDQGSCTKHVSLLRGVMRCCEVSTQTPRINGSLNGMTYEEEFSSCDNSLLDVQVVTGGGIVSRPTQTIASCLAGRTVAARPFSGTPVEMQGLLSGQQDPLNSRTDHKTQGSIESLPSQSDIDETASMHSFTTSLPRHFQSSAPGSKKDGLHSPSLVSADKEELIRRFCTMSKTAEGCCALRQTGCIPVLIQIMHDGSLLNLPAGWTHPPGPGQLCHTVTSALKAAKEIRIGMCQALRSIVMHTAPEGKQSAEGPILAQLECIRGYCERLFELWIYVQTLGANKQDVQESSAGGLNGAAVENGPSASSMAADVTSGSNSSANSERFDFRNGLVALYKPPMQSISAIMKLSHNEAVRGVINDLGGLFAVAELFVLHCRCASSTDRVYACVGGDLPHPDDRILAQLQLLRRYVGFSLINLTYGDMQNKATLIQMPGLLDVVMMQLGTESEELQQAMARFLRNLSWQPDEKSRDILREKDVVSVLMNCALKSKREVTLNSVLSALWNLSGHCVENRTSICSVKGALGFLVWTLTYRSPSKSPAIIESGGGILRNVSSVVATNEDYRQILRENNCLQILLTHLKAASLTIVSNACGTLWNLSARNAQDQKLLWELGAVPMLRNLVHSKHNVIAQGSSAALRNLLSNRPDKLAGSVGDRGENTKLKARKQKSLDSFGPKGTNESSTAADNFSPRHHTWTGYEKTTSPRPTLATQRRSLQETSSSSPTSDHDKNKRFNKGAAHYSGSLGSLPSSDFGEAFSKSYTGTSSKYVTGARNSSSFPDHYSSGGAAGRALRGSMTIDFTQNGTQRGGSAMYPGGFSPISSGGMLKDVLMSSDATPTQNATQAGKGTKPAAKRPSQIGLLQYSQFVASGKAPQPGSLSASFGATPHHYQSQGQGSPLDSNRVRMYAGGNVDVNAMRQGQLQRASLTPGRHEALQSQYLMSASSPSWPATTKADGSLGMQSNNPQTDRSQVPHVRGQAFAMSSSQRLQNLIKNSHVPGLNLAAPNPIMLNLGIGPAKNPDDLVRALRCEEEQYGDDDDLVNYSLQYRDEHMTPGIQSPRTEEIYENACETIDEAVVNSGGPHSQVGRFLRTQMGGPSVPLASTGPATHSEGGLSGLSSCIDSTGSNGRQDTNNNPGAVSTGHTRDSSASLLPVDPPSLQAFKNGQQRFSAEHDVMDGDMRYDDPTDFDDEKPTDFSARFAEEQLYEPIQHQSMGMMPYSGAQFGEKEQHERQDENVQPAPVQKVASNQSEAEDEHRGEEEDKFDSGAITPAHYHHTKSGRNSGIMTPRTPGFQETPMMFSRSSSPESLSDCGSIHSSMTSEPGSRMISGNVSPSMLPDSPSQSMPQSPRRSPSSRSLTNLNQPEQNLPKFGNAPPVKPKPLPSRAVTQKSYTPDVTRPQNTGPLPSASAVIEQRLKKLDEPGYTSSLPHKDETNVFKSEGAMSVVTTFSALTVDSNDKIAPVLDDRAMSVIGSAAYAKPDAEKENQEQKAASPPGGSEHEDGQEALQAGQRAVVNAGYITSLPTSDEIMTFMHEGTLSPMSAFSEMSCLKEHNDGFEKRSGSTYSVPNSSSSNKIGAPRSIASNKTSFASRSSATGASFPPPPETCVAGATAASVDAADKLTSPKDESNDSNVTSPTGLSAGGGDEDLSDSDDSLPSASSDDEDLLKRCIDHAIPKKKSSRNWSSKSSTRSGGSRSSSRGGKSRSKEKSSSDASGKLAPTAKPPDSVARAEEEPPKQEENRRTTNPSPEVVKERVKLINIKEKIAAADSKLKLKGLTIREYMDNLAKLDDSIEGEDGLQAETSGNHATGVQRSREVIGNVETLQQSYSVKKKLRENERQARNTADVKNAENAQSSIPKTTGFLPSEMALSAQCNLRIQSYIREGMASYATEGTPIEMSRSTSLSNLTIDSDSLEITDLTTLQNRLKTSHSVPDIKSEAANLKTEDLDHTTGDATVDEAARGSATTTDSREILEDLGKQIESLTLNVAESVIARKDPGYMTSLPHSDEIQKYAAEGSQSGATEFSALTIDSDTRIAPLQMPPMEGITEYVASTDAAAPSQNSVPQHLTVVPQNASSFQQPGNVMPQMQNVPRQSLPCTQNATTHQLPPDGHEDPLSPSKLVDQNVRSPGNVMPPPPRPAVPPPVEDTPQVYSFNHYNNENDGMPVKEERITFKNEDTPICFSSNSSLSSLSSEGDGLLEDCITSALPQERNPASASMTGNMSMNPPTTLDTLGRYSDGVPDGKVDSPTGQRIPFFSQRHPQPLQARSQTFISSPTLLQSPSDEQWRMFQQESEAISAQLLQQATHEPVWYAASRSGEMPSSYSYPENMDGLYYTRQSARDSDFSMESSTRGRPLAMPQPRKARSRQQYDRRVAASKTSQGHRKDLKSGKKSGPGRQREPPAGRQRNTHDRNSSSESSPSYHHNQRRRHISTGNAKHVDRRNECGCQAACSRASSQPRCYHHKMASASTSRLEEAMSPTRSRRRSTNSGSKNSFVACDQHSHHHQPKQTRSRVTAKNVYRPSVIQLYPPLKDMDGLLKGVASVAARGDKVVHERGPVRYHSSSNAGVSVKSSTSSLSTGQSLIRQGTFITDSPSPVLLQNMPKDEQEKAPSKSSSVSSSPPQSFRSTRSAGNGRATTPRGSVHSVKSCSVVSSYDTSAAKTKKKAAPQSQKKAKHKKVWNGIKKLLSPSDDAKATTKDSPGPKTTGAVKKTQSNMKGSKSPKNVKKTISNAKNAKQQPTNRLTTSLPEPVKQSTSSLSLSSSSPGENSDSEQEDAARMPRDATAPYGHLPKSPSAGSASLLQFQVTKSQSAGGSVWRRTPPFPTTDATRHGMQASPTGSRGSATSKSFLPRSRTFVSSEQEVFADVHDSPVRDSDVWVSQEQLTSRNGVGSEAASSCQSQPVATKCRNQVSSNETSAPEGPSVAAKNGPNELATPGFPPPPRTQSPRVVQQVAPFNYKPQVPPETPANVWVEKKPRRAVESGCKQTSV